MVDRRRGRPLLGLISGFFFGLFLGLTLLFLTIIPLDSILLVALPVGLAIVVPLVAWFFPIGGGPPAATAAAAAEPATSPPATSPPSADGE